MRPARRRRRASSFTDQSRGGHGAHASRWRDGRSQPGATVTVEPGGMHLMLVDLKAPLVAGKSVPLVLSSSAGKITVQLRSSRKGRLLTTDRGNRHETVRMLSARRDRRLTPGIRRR